MIENTIETTEEKKNVIEIDETVTVKEISEKLFLSVKTISTYRTRMLEKMGMKTNSELTRYAIQHGLDD
mgnify:CR=1 FL=1